MNNSISEMDKAVKCLALELPEPVWKDVNERWQSAKGDIGKTKEALDKIIYGHETEVLKELLACSEMAAIAKGVVNLIG